MGDFSPVDDVTSADDGEAAGVAAFGGFETCGAPDSAAWCVAAVPLGSCENAGAGCTGGARIFAGGPVDVGAGASGFRGSSVVVLARRQRLNIPSMHLPMNYWRHTATPAGLSVDAKPRRPSVTPQMLYKRAKTRVPIT
jgi:hypothetical protein